MKQRSRSTLMDAARTSELLTKADRCDRCGAEAKEVTSHVYTDAHGESRIGLLLWCDHHHRKHIGALLRAT